jgi:adenine-specific DNA-methyltransferase
LKRTGAGDLFTIFGSPAIELKRDGDAVTVEVLGVDVHDPTTRAVRSRATDEIALWMIDTDCDETSCFVRHCYFTGGGDPVKRLKTVLRPRSTPTPGRRSAALHRGRSTCH